MTKGQMFSLDFMIAASILILGIGLLMNSAYLISYEAREKLDNRNLNERAEAGLTALFSSANAGCDINGHYAAYSIDISKLNSLTDTNENDTKLKSALGLGDYKVYLEIDDIPKIDDLMVARNIYSIEMEVMQCSNSSVAFSSLRNCMNTGACAEISQKKLKLMVGK